MLNLTYIAGLELINFLSSFTFCKPSLLNYIEKHIKKEREFGISRSLGYCPIE